MMQDLRDNTVNQGQAAKLSAKQLEGKLVRGVLADRDRPSFLRRYDELCERVARERSSGSEAGS
jgi:hypothetical protein